MDTAPAHDAGRQATSTAAGPSRVLVNAPDLMALREAFAAMVPAAVVDPDAPGTSHPAGPEAIASPDGVESEAIDRIAVLEQLKAAVAAAQIRETAALHAHRTTAESRRGVPVKRRGRGLGGEIGLARGIGPHTGSRELRQAVNVAADLPNTLAALQAGALSESQAAAVERQTQWLDPDSRRVVDSHLVSLFGCCGIKDLTRAAQAEAAAQDPEAAAERYASARRDRHVSLKPSESTPGMAYLTALLPVEQAAACYRNLVETATRLISEGEAEKDHVADATDGPRVRRRGRKGGRHGGRDGGRTSGREGGQPGDDEHGGRTPMQILTDTLVERLSGQSSATAVPVEVHLVMTDAALFGTTPAGTETSTTPATRTGRPRSNDVATGARPRAGVAPAPEVGPASESRASTARAAWLPGVGPLPAPVARRLLATTEADVFLRRLYTAPQTGQLTAMDSQRRVFSGGLRRMILIRDGTCRTPFCGAPIKHLDHATPVREGGPTSYQNGSGLCVSCNMTKEHPGWTHEATAELLTVTTPTGHRYTRPTAPLLPPQTMAAEPAEPAETAELIGAGSLSTETPPEPEPALTGPVDFGLLRRRRVIEYEPQHQDAA